MHVIHDHDDKDATEKPEKLVSLNNRTGLQTRLVANEIKKFGDAGYRRYRATRNIYPELRIESRAPASTCGCACIQTGRSGMTNSPEGLVRRLIPTFPRFDGPARSQKPSLVTSNPRPRPENLPLLCHPSSLYP